MTDTKTRTAQEEVDRNFDFFQSELPRLTPKYMGKFALVRDREITGFYDTASDAYTSARALYEDGLFSIQQITSDIVDLGFYSHAMHLGTA